MDKIDTLLLDGRQLKLFLAILDERSVSKAAERFALNQSTASHHLDKLRRSLGDPLFVKLGQGITPTDHAISLAPRIRELVASIEGLSAESGYDPSSDERMITVAANTAECLPMLSALRLFLSETTPNAPLRFLELGSRSRIETLLESGEADLVLTVRAVRYPASVKWIEFSSDRLVCFFDGEQRDPVQTPAEYCAAGHAALDFGGVRKSTVELAVERAGYERQIQLSAPDVNALAKLIVGTTLIATFQSDLKTSVFRDLDCCDVPMEMPNMYQDLVWHRRQDASPRNQWLRAAVLASRPNSASGFAESC